MRKEQAKQRVDIGRRCVCADERWFVIVVWCSMMCSVFDVPKKKLVCARSAACLLA